MLKSTAGYVCATLEQVYRAGSILAQMMEEQNFAAQSVEVRRLLRGVNSIIGQDAQSGKRDDTIWLNSELLRDAVWAMEQWAEAVKERFSDAPTFTEFYNMLSHAVFVADMVEMRLAWMHRTHMAVWGK